jgi:hypothetical protein
MMGKCCVLPDGLIAYLSQSLLYQYRHISRSYWLSSGSTALGFNQTPFRLR